MTADRWTRMVRQQVGLGRFLPLGGPYDGAWIAERAAGGALREAAEREVPEVRLDGVRLGLADPDRAADPAVPPPPSALLRARCGSRRNSRPRRHGPCRRRRRGCVRRWRWPRRNGWGWTWRRWTSGSRNCWTRSRVRAGAGRRARLRVRTSPGLPRRLTVRTGPGRRARPGAPPGPEPRTLPRARARLTRRGWPALPAGRARGTPHTLSAVMPQREQRMTVAPGRKASGSPMRCPGCRGEAG